MSFGISIKTDYGVLLMTALAEYKGEFVSLRTIAKQKKLPYHFLAQIIKPLRTAKLVSSKEGMSGGYTLTKNPRDITLKEIVEALEGPIATTRCTHNARHTCPAANVCGPKNEWNTLKNSISTLLENKTLADLAKKKKYKN